MLKIFHNPRCSKSRQTLKLISDSNKEVEVVEYLNNPPTAEELRHIVELLGLPIEYLIRKNETIFKENFKDKDLSEDEWYEILASHPKLLERPIVVKGDEAILGRPPENVLKLLN